MAGQECASEASIIGDEYLDVNSPTESKNFDFHVPEQEEITGGEQATSTMTKHGEAYENCDREEVFQHIPQLKDIFRIKSKIGEGTFSDVYLANLIEDPDELFALKYIIPTSAPDRVEREIRCLQEMGGTNNVIGYKGTVRNHDHSAVILPYFPHDKFQDYLYDMNVADIQDYMKNLMQALKHIHSFSIIHRDVKPGNFLHSRKTRRYNLVDFGLAMHEPGSDKAWEIEKKKGEKVKKANGKNVRLLSPESCRSSQAPKKARTSPRIAVTSHKLSRQAGAASKSALKTSNKQNRASHELADKVVTETIKRSGHLKDNSEMFSTFGRLNSGRCETNHMKSEVCSLCMKRSTQNAPRAGTSGFRAPEVLMKHPGQTTAVDVWSAGVVMLCLLSGRYPFFRCSDDMMALAQIISLFGKQRVMESTKQLGKYLVSNTHSTGFDLKSVCQKLRSCTQKESERIRNECCAKCNKTKTAKRQRSGPEEPAPGANSEATKPRTTSVSGKVTSSNSIQKSKVRFLSTGNSPQTDRPAGLFSSGFPESDGIREHLDGSRCTCHCGSCLQYIPTSAYDLLERCLDLNPVTRITASQALRHPFFAKDCELNCSSRPVR